jgi:hypothetical protein
MFRSRFADAFPAKCPHMGPQDVERGVAEDIPSPLVESLLCALLGLVLNRKKPVELVALFNTQYTASGSRSGADSIGAFSLLTLCASQERSLWPRPRRGRPNPKVTMATVMESYQPPPRWSLVQQHGTVGTREWACLVWSRYQLIQPA